MATSQDEDMYLFDSGFEQTPAAFAGQAFDDFLPLSPPEKDANAASSAFMNPNDLTMKQESEEQTTTLGNMASRMKARSPASSESSSQSSSSTSAKLHQRNISATSTASPSVNMSSNGAWRSGINGLSMPSNDELFADTDMSGFDSDFESSNQQMASDFDFETAASTPSGFGNAILSSAKPLSAMPSFQGHPSLSNIAHVKSAPVQPQFYFRGSREASPLSAMLPAAHAPSPWSKHSPSSGLEETFNGITMNGDSPNNATFSPNLSFPAAGFTFDPESSATPSTFAKDISSPPSTINSVDGAPQLTVYPTSLKSRVETQIPIRMILSPMPAGVTKLRLPTHTVSKPKFLIKGDVERSPEILELHTSLVCTSAMQDPTRLDRAFARARGEELMPLSRPSPASSIGSHNSRDDDDKPLNGGEVKICAGCIQRERKRASRKKQKKPDEEELFQKDEEKRVIVFNTNEVKEWVEPTKDGQGVPANLASRSSAPGAMQVELPMRIACYCRHQNEKMGFQVIFTIKDMRDRVIAQAITNPIMITDDHKTHNAPAPVPTTATPLPNAPQLPGAGVFSTSGVDLPGTLSNAKLFKQSFSTTDLHGLQHNFNPNFPMASTNNPFVVPSAVSSDTSATLTPRNLSRPASPTALPGPTNKRRKQSGSGKLPSGLTMTRLETGHGPTGSSTMPSSATSPFPANMPSFMASADRAFAMPTSRPGPFETSPPTPTSNEALFMTGINRSFSMENLPRQALISAPNSRQPSRPGSPSSNRNSFGAVDANFGQAVANQLQGNHSRRPPPLIHKLVPAEGSVTGGTEVTLLGNGFYQGLEVMFGDTEATTTTFWGEKCLNCIAPPAIQPGPVAVVFKHEHPLYASTPPQSQARQTIFTYTDDREVEMYRLALKTIGKQMQHPTDDPFSAAQQLLGGPMQSYWPTQGNYGGMTGHQRAAGVAGADPVDLLELESNMLRLLNFTHVQGVSVSSKFEARRPSGLTLLHLSSSLGLTRFVAGLLSRGTDPNVLDNNGNTPMHHAAMNGHTHIVHRLRLAGADNTIRSIRNFVPADLATSLLAHQAALIPNHHYRSRSAGGTPIRLHSRNASSTSLKSFWERASTNYACSDFSDMDSDGDSEFQTTPERSADNAQLPSSVARLATSRRTSSRAGSRQGSAPAGEPVEANEPSPSPAAYMMAWRNSLAAQIHQFQESTQWVMPNLPTLPALPDYQTYPMARRISSLFPQRPNSRQAPILGAKEGWWESLTARSPSPSAPPAYNDLYPSREEEEDDTNIKKASAVIAAADAIADQHFEAQASSVPALPISQSSGTARESRRVIVHDGKPVHRIELSRDRKLFFFWIPVLAIVLGLMLRSSLTDVWSSVIEAYQLTLSPSLADQRVEQAA